MRVWEQTEVKENIPVYPVNITITKPELTFNIRGDQHIGLKCVNVPNMIAALKYEQTQHKDNIFVVDTGDIIENGLGSSIGHNYDVGVADPQEQIDEAIRVQNELDAHLYGDSFDTIDPCTRSKTRHAKRFGVIGNHEYRTRKQAGIWLNKQLYGPQVKGVVDGGIHCIISLKITNPTLKLSKTYKIYLAHRLTNSSAGISHATLMKNFGKKMKDIDADIYVCGHYHHKFVGCDYKFGSDGKKKKVMFVCNPSPADVTEYGLWAQYSPIGGGFYTNIYLPIEKHKNAYGII